MAGSVSDHVWTIREIARRSIETDPVPPSRTTHPRTARRLKQHRTALLLSA
jgi:hypothetical protein